MKNYLKYLNQLLNRLYQKNELLFALFWILIYVVLISIADAVSISLHLQKSVTVIACFILSFILFRWIRLNHLQETYGLCPATISAEKLLYYLPLVLLVTVNLWFSPGINLSLLETLLYMLSMLMVGFLEEIIFRGLLFKALAKDGLKTAIVISSVTFGIGHLVNLINGSGANLFSNILQVIYAIAAGLMFTLLFFCTKSLYACILCHGFFNALSVFANDAAMSMQREIFLAGVLCLITGGYSLYLLMRHFIPEYKRSQSSD